MKKYSFLVLILVLIFSCERENINPDVEIIPESDTTQTDTTGTDIPPIVELTCPIDINNYEFDTLNFEIINSAYTYAEFNPCITIQGWSFEQYQAGDVVVLSSDGLCDGGCGNSVVAGNGFDKSCGIVGCWYTYLTYMTEDNSIHIANDSATLKSFLGDIDTKDEALLWAYANGYEMKYNTQNTKENGIKEVDFGYELKVYKTVGSGCGGLVTRTDYQIHICPEGQITILSEEVVFNQIVYTCYD